MNSEILRRRTLAIISHPDAGKTTLTEKLLLYGGALDLAGSVTAKKKQRDTASDWMELEKKRGISISSTVLQFEYKNYRFNLLDTPGHKDFSEDTYRVLTAVDGAIMIIDGAKGIENQTLKLYEVCKKHKIPVFTFINKFDRPTKMPLTLIDEVEQILGLKTYPVNWPIENGYYFKGVYDRMVKEVHLFERTSGGTYRAPFSVHSIDDNEIKKMMHEEAYNNFIEEVDLLEELQLEFDRDKILQGELSPVYFGSAANNFGVELLLKGFLEHSSPPTPRRTNTGQLLPLNAPFFSAFVFKIQTNMDPMHRDRMVFARVCSGKFERDTKVFNSRNKKEIRLSSSHSVFGKERKTADEAYPGDVIGFITNADFKIGDTISSDINIIFEKIPRFAPEMFAYINNSSTSKYKAFRKGLEHLIAEDIVQTFQLDNNFKSVPLLGALGLLQFEVLQYRLRDEYAVETTLEIMPWTLMRWLENPVESEILKKKLIYSGVSGTDYLKRQVLFFENKWRLETFREKNQEVELLDSITDY
ncbi:MAG TPA: peptide chain release factor 3 [Lentisphaeria bacterium]|nr:MAG: peptide chain release factor 3 [Lentisphaerae bacterium GWF2_38_69]HBM16238.1 peptide chain release factor 3 [Lentisphaeria bacterium]